MIWKNKINYVKLKQKNEDESNSINSKLFYKSFPPKNVYYSLLRPK